MEEQVILVDSSDNELGVEEKMAAHRSGKLHRAISTFVFDSRGRLLLQKRAAEKYHSAGLWSNTCCSHPRPSEHQAHAARRRLGEEMGIECNLDHVFAFTYRAELDNNLLEYEFDHVFFGKFDGEPIPNAEEVEDWKWMTLPQLCQDIKDDPLRYSAWFRICINQVITVAAQGVQGYKLPIY